MNAMLARTLTDVSIQSRRPASNGYPNFAQAWNVPARIWEREVMKDLTRFCQLPRNWDGYGGQPAKWDAGMFALHILGSIMNPRTPVPQIVPTSVGGVQLEWHEKDVDLELHVIGPFECELWFQDHRNPQVGGVTKEITNDFSSLKEPINLLNTR